ncbi:Spy/CpxP family protein refolding chaperone [Bradyrhizobium sp.]|uniref:Spy/CpxP family protein refolding chaperone n=1 Tax=Bradyrhizobium sp. TaxID=376 RepID=UPI001DB9CC46|nr:Spy/CpxP family protein refolding chaperone [Bradyrhizobium sp.]MBI5319557.1 Spy/CpxP family protein refolding chaperone [Bradyrhizobium sp.]
MSRWRIGIAGIAALLLTTLLPTEAPARMRIGINPIGVAKMAVGRVLSLGRMRHARSHARHGKMRTAALRPQDIRKAMAAGPADPAARRQIVAVAALAGLPKVAADGWWRHSDGSYGWVGPLFWPFAIYDVHDYAILGDGTGFWNYGYPDIYAGIFAPYGRADLAAFSSTRPAGRSQRRVPLLQQLCGDDSREVGGLVGELQQAVQPNNEAQRAALDDLAKALIMAAHMIRSSCPTQAAPTAPERLAIMQQRIGTMIAVQSALQQPLTKFYDLLDDEQEVRLNALAADRRKTAPADAGPDAAACGPAQSTALQWPAAEIEARLNLNDTQRTALKSLQDANAMAIGILSACPPTDTTTPPARLDAADARLEAMQQAIYLVSVALGEFYATLNDEQKAKFEAIGQKRTA